MNVRRIIAQMIESPQYFQGDSITAGRVRQGLQKIFSDVDIRSHWNSKSGQFTPENRLKKKTDCLISVKHTSTKNRHGWIFSMTLRWPSIRFGGVAITMGFVRNRASLSTFVTNSGLSQALSQKFASHETVAVNTVKTWRRPPAGRSRFCCQDS